MFKERRLRNFFVNLREVATPYRKKCIINIGSFLKVSQYMILVYGKVCILVFLLENI